MRKVILKIAPPYDNEIIEKIRAGFVTLLGHEIELEIIEDKNLIGGFLAYADGKVYDASLKTRLMDMRHNLSD
jgi:F0F1-type ATP synthase delta subunit